jgi:TRAP-type C4-dicarboxylate transport system permease large subunit
MEPVHLVIIVCVNLVIGSILQCWVSTLLLTAACRIAGVRYEESFRFLMPLYAAMVLVLIFLVAFPQIALWIPDLLID